MAIDVAPSLSLSLSRVCLSMSLDDGGQPLPQHGIREFNFSSFPALKSRAMAFCKVYRMALKAEKEEQA